MRVCNRLESLQLHGVGEHQLSETSSVDHPTLHHLRPAGGRFVERRATGFQDGVSDRIGVDGGDAVLVQETTYRTLARPDSPSEKPATLHSCHDGRR